MILVSTGPRLVPLIRAYRITKARNLCEVGSTPTTSTKFNNMNTDIVKKEDFKRYVDVQMSGITNMFDVKTVSALADLAVDQILDIMKNYEKYNKQWSTDL